MKIQSAVDLSDEKRRILDFVTEQREYRFSTFVERMNRDPVVFWPALLSLLEAEKIVIVGVKEPIICLLRTCPSEGKTVIGKPPVRFQLVAELTHERVQRQEAEKRKMERDQRDEAASIQAKVTYDAKIMAIGEQIDLHWRRQAVALRQSLRQQQEAQKVDDFDAIHRQLATEKRRYFESEWHRLHAGDKLPKLVEKEFLEDN